MKYSDSTERGKKMSVTLVYNANTPGFVFNPNTDEGFLMTARYWGKHEDEMSEESRTMIARTMFVGAVLDLQEENGYDDSDFYAVVWDGENITRVEYGSTRHAGIGSAKVDATTDTLIQAANWLEEWNYNRQKEKSKVAALDPVVGRLVRSTIASGPKAGIEGMIKWRGANKFRTYYAKGYNKPDDINNQVVGIKVEGKEKLVFINATSVEVLNPEKYLPSEEDLRLKAKLITRQRLWAQPFYRLYG